MSAIYQLILNKLSPHFHWRQPLKEDASWWEVIYDGHLKKVDNGCKTSSWWYMTLIKEVLWLKTEFDGRWIFDGRWTLMEYDLSWKTTFDGERNFMPYEERRLSLLISEDNWSQDDRFRKTKFHGRLPFMEEDLRWQKTYWWKNTIANWRKTIFQYCSITCVYQNVWRVSFYKP